MNIISLFSIISFFYLVLFSWPMALRSGAAVAVTMILSMIAAVAAAYKKSQYEGLSGLRFNIIDFSFFAYFAYGLFSLLYSFNYYASLTETIFMFSNVSAYLVFRITASFAGSDRYLKNAVYVSTILLIVLLFGAFVKKAITADGRLYFLMLHPNLVGTLICIFCAPVVYNYLKAAKKIFNYIFGIFMLAMAYLTVLTGSRGAMGGFACGFLSAFLIYVFCERKNKNIYKIITGAIFTFFAALIVFMFCAPAYYNRITSIFDYNAVSSAGGRLGVWQAAWSIFIENPFIGSGTGTFAYQAQKYGIINTLDAHNFILDILSNSGIFGMILYLLPFALIALKMWKRIGLISGKSESSKESEVSGYAIDAAVIFTVVSVHFNSLFSPHLTFPVTSLPLYALCAIYSAAPLSGTLASKDKNGKKAKNVGNAIIGFEMHFQYNKFIFISLLIISFVLLPQCFKLYSADVSNFKGVDIVAVKGDFSRATALFEDASSKWRGAAYLLNNSICVLLEELTKPLESRKAEPLAKAKILAEKAEKYSPHNILIKNYIGVIDKTAVEIKNRSLNRPGIEREKILAAPQGALNAFAMAYGKNAYKEFSDFNEKLIKEILEKMNSGASADIMSNYSSYLGDSLNYAVNFDIAGIEDGLAEYIKKTAKETQQAVKYLPLVDYDYKIKSGLYSQEKLVVTTGAYILPMIWKFGRGLERSAVKENLDKILENTSFADMKLMPVIDCFAYAQDSAENEFQSYGNNYNRYWKLVKSFSDGKFEEIIENGDFLKTVNDKTLEKMGIRRQNGYILLSWAHYKIKNYGEAKKLIYQSLAMSLDSNYEFTYKAGLLFDGAIEEFYRPSLYSYYDQSVMMALIRAHKGDYKKILPEIFDYLNAVIFN